MNETDVRTALDKFWNDKTCEECGADFESDEIEVDTWFGPEGENEDLCWGCAANRDLEELGSGWTSVAKDEYLAEYPAGPRSHRKDAGRDDGGIVVNHWVQQGDDWVIKKTEVIYPNGIPRSHEQEAA